MQSSATSKTLVTLALLVFLVGAVLHFFKRSPEQSVYLPPEIFQKTKPASSQNFSSRKKSATPANDSATESNDKSANPLAISREKIEGYLKLHHRDAESLLAAFHASGDETNEIGDINYLKEAATNYPNDPHVQLTVLAHDVFPEDRRKWLDAFKESSPSNSLANYLSARDYFKNNQPDAAIKEIMEATGKSQFADFSMEAFLGNNIPITTRK